MATNAEGETTYLISDVSERVGLSQKRIREYEKGGLISPEREPRTNNRRYCEADVRRIMRIKALIHEHGFTVACLRFFLASAPCWIVFDCKHKTDCTSYREFHVPCYEIAKRAAPRRGRYDCATCPVYLNRRAQPMPLLEKP